MRAAVDLFARGATPVPLAAQVLLLRWLGCVAGSACARRGGARFAARVAQQSRIVLGDFDSMVSQSTSHQRLLAVASPVLAVMSPARAWVDDVEHRALIVTKLKLGACWLRRPSKSTRFGCGIDDAL